MPTISAIEGVVTALFVLVILGTLKMAAVSHPDNKFSKAVLLLY